MPSFRIFVLEDPERDEGRFEEWDLPWQRLVFDQRLEYARGGGEPARWRVCARRRDALGEYFVVAEEKGVPEGADPKKVRYRRP